MLNYFCKGACVFAAALTFTATSAQAEGHNILIVDGGYFPTISYVSPGDSIVFTNVTQNAQIVVGSDEIWNSGLIPVNGTYSLEVSEEMPLSFHSVDLALTGSLSFEEAPLSE